LWAAILINRYNWITPKRVLRGCFLKVLPTEFYRGLKRFRRFNESRIVIQVKSESTLVNKGSNLKIHANDIVPFARKRALVAAA